jgi:hypothetical protein
VVRDSGASIALLLGLLYARSGVYHSAFHDVVTGDNSVMRPTGVFVGYEAGRGWDPVTGWGGPSAQVLVPLLARTAR